MIYQIDSKVAQEVGFVGAILFHHICFWIKKNKANQKHFHDGEYWTYSSIKGFAEYFEDLSERQIKQGLLNLKEKGFLKCGNFNKNPYDRTNWYALDKKGYSIVEKSLFDETKLSNQTDKSVQPIPDIITYIKTDISKENIIKEKTQNETLAEEIYQSYPRKVAKANAIKAILTAITKKKVDASWLKQRVQAYANAVERWSDRDKAFIPHPATWINGERYNDNDAEWDKSNSYQYSSSAQSQYTHNQLMNAWYTKYPATRHPEQFTAEQIADIRAFIR